MIGVGLKYWLAHPYKTYPPHSHRFFTFDVTGSFSIAQLVGCPLSEPEVMGSNPVAAPYQRCKNWY